MRPTPAETIAGVRRVLRDVVEPEVASEHARSRLSEIRAVLAQVDWDDAALRVRTRTETLLAALDSVAAWAKAEPARAAHFVAMMSPPPALPIGPASFADLDAAHRASGTRLAAAANLLETWQRSNPTDQTARALLVSLVRLLAEEEDPA